MSKRENKFLRNSPSSVGPFEHAALTADTAGDGLKFWVAHRRCKVVAAYYHNVTGLAEHADNHFALSVRNGSTVVAGPLSTDADGAGDNGVVADTWTAIPLTATLADRKLDAGDVLSFFADEGGTATLPAGRVLVFVENL